MSLVATENLVHMNNSNSSINTLSEGEGMSHFLQEWLTPSPKFNLVTAESFNRDEVEKYIERQFEATYGAKLTEFLPIFLTLSCAGKLSASTGISLGSESGRYFLEQYLEKPIECELGQICGEQINRKKLVEIGNLVATSQGANRLMLITLASVLSQAGYEWMVFTATKPLLHSLHKLGFETHVMADAKPARLDNSSSTNWGSYYENKPQVVAGRLSSAQQIVVDRRLFSLVQAFYKTKIDSLSFEIREIGDSHA
jgi:hypothetical protein